MEIEDQNSESRIEPGKKKWNLRVRMEYLGAFTESTLCSWDWVPVAHWLCYYYKLKKLLKIEITKIDIEIGFGTKYTHNPHVSNNKLVDMCYI